MGKIPIFSYMPSPVVLETLRMVAEVKVVGVMAYRWSCRAVVMGVVRTYHLGLKFHINELPAKFYAQFIAIKSTPP